MKMMFIYRYLNKSKPTLFMAATGGAAFTTNEDAYIKEFFEHREKNIETAYQELLNNVISTLKPLFTGPVVVQTPDGRSFDLEYITNQIKIKTAPLYIVDNNPNKLIALPNNLTELHPRPDNQIKLRSLYNQLKRSIATTNLDILAEESIPNGDVRNLRYILKDFNTRKDIPKSHMTNHYYLTGKILLYLKNHQQTVSEFLKDVKHDVGYSKSYTYFLIDFYLLCSRYTKLRTVAFPIGKIKTHFSYIKDAVCNDAQFWN